jgi:putative ABC transport system ATP-binding protein
MSKLLIANEVSKVYEASGYPSLDRVSFDVDAGEFIGIMGASGSGKTTLLNVLSTIDTPTGGKIDIDGVELNKLGDKAAADFRRDKLGFIFQEYFLLDSLTVFENIVVPLALLAMPHRKIEARIHELAERFGIVSQLKKYPNELSGGQRQRTAAARALVKNPSVLFADEPAGALDSNSSTELLKMLDETNCDLGTTILMVTHDAYAASFASRILILKDGKILNELYQNEHNTRNDFYGVILNEIAKADTLRQ